ncbi:MAG: glycosyltransferase family 4 protein [Candidatus Kerfeldbacteria bacterium]|nr:glycosyltransferase family 4 protein [Candidatus Kerfeldbacteria bacterium]
MRVLFITRKFPPQVGGMEHYSYALIESYPEEKITITLRHRRLHLVWFLPYALVMGLYYSRRVDLVYLTDGLLAPLGYLLKVFCTVPVIITAHGLDVTYDNWAYRKLVIPSIRRLDHVVTVSRQTIAECTARGIDIERCTCIPNGFDAHRIASTREARSVVQSLIGVSGEGRFILLTVGRLIKRKGVQWFIERVLPHLPPEVLYVIVGRGEEYDRIRDSIAERGLERRVRLLGFISNETLRRLYGSSDLFIMPNVKVPGDIEGFGIVALEAAASGVPVIASRLEGIQEAITEGRNGILVASNDASAFIRTITRLMEHTAELQQLSVSSRTYTVERYNWSVIIRQYQQLFQEVRDRSRASTG